MVNLSHLGMTGQEVYHTQGILHVSFHSQAQCLQSLQQNPRIEGRNGSTRIAQDDSTDARHKSRLTSHVSEYCPVVRWVGFGQRGELVGVGFPVELAAVNNNSAQRRSMAAQEFRSRMDHNIGPMLQWTYEVRRAEGIIYNQGNVMAMSHGRNPLDVQHVAVGISKGLGKHHLSVRLYGSLQGLQVVHVYNGVRNAQGTQCVSNQVIRPAI